MEKFEIEFDCVIETKVAIQKAEHIVTIYDNDIDSAISQLKAAIIKSYEQCKVMYLPDLIDISLDFFNEHYANIKYSNFRKKEV